VVTTILREEKNALNVKLKNLKVAQAVHLKEIITTTTVVEEIDMMIIDNVTLVVVTVVLVVVAITIVKTAADMKDAIVLIK
jgi:hypothetical protein